MLEIGGNSYVEIEENSFHDNRNLVYLACGKEGFRKIDLRAFEKVSRDGDCG